MSTLAPTPTRPPRDRGNADLELLTGHDVNEMLGAALGVVEATVLSWRVRDVSCQPRTGSTASYRVQVRWSDGRITDEMLGASTGSLPANALAVERGRSRAAVWRVPNDPDLPGLAAASDPRRVASLLGELGLGAGPVRLVTRAYRPRRRAVIEAVGPSGRVFIKVVRPDRIEALHERHRLLTANGLPTPASLGWNPDGLLVLAAVPGATMRELVLAGSADLPDPGSIMTMLDRIPVEAATGTSRSWLDRVRHYAGVVAAAVPAEAVRVERVADAIHAEAGVGPTVAVHGDLYDSQILVEGGRISGLLDVDTIRLGDRLDDLGCLLGHLSVLARIDPRRAASINAIGARHLAEFGRHVDPADLRYRTAAVVVSLATGPHRVQEADFAAKTSRLVDLAEQWLASARRAAARR